MQPERPEATLSRPRRSGRGGPRPSPLSRALGLGALLLTLCCTSCTEGEGGPHGFSTPPTSTLGISTPDTDPSGPPLRFDTDDGVPLPSQAAGGRITINGRAISPLPLVLHDGIIYLASAGDLQLLRTGSSSKLKTVTGGDGEATDADGERWVAPPVLTTVGTKELVVSAFAAGAPGSGRRVRIVAVDTGSRTEDWNRSLTPRGAPAAARTMRVRVVGAGGDALVLTVSGDGVTDTYAVDLPEGQVRWRMPGFEASTVAGSVVVGLSSPLATESGVVAKGSSGGEEQRVRGVSLTRGKYLWTAAHAGYGLKVQGAGDTYVVVTRPTGVATGLFALLRTSDGSQVRSWRGKDFGQSCHFDGSGITVCAGTDPQTVVAIDGATGKILWQLPDSSAEVSGSAPEVPRVTTAWHGVVYGLRDDKAVVLDARDGHFLSEDAGIAPLLVDETAGIAFDLGDSRLKAFSVVH
jgi:outer membrane protein assembly factor BamB